MAKLIEAVVAWNGRRHTKKAARAEKARMAAIRRSNEEIAKLQVDFSGYVSF